jgi:hypothetical protein
MAAGQMQPVGTLGVKINREIKIKIWFNKLDFLISQRYLTVELHMFDE